MPRLSVQQLFEDRRERLGLAWAAGASGSHRELTNEMLSRGGLGLIGHLNFIHPLIVQVLGTSELEYLAGLGESALAETAERLAGGDTLCIVVGDGLAVPAALERAATAAAVPLLTARESSQQVINILRPYLQGELGEVTSLHGVFLDVLEIGVLITGESSIGKSELALELISRGHGLVADDVVELQQIGPETVQGRCPPMLRDFLEVRGLGVLNIRSIFGETAVRPRKVLRLIVHLEFPAGGAYEERDRLNTRSGTRNVLGVEIPSVTLTVAPGRNLAVLVEAAVRNHILMTRGIDSTRDFIGRQAAAMRAGDAADREPGRLMQLMLVSGVSGSGKSVALKALEDSGYFCVDNLPPSLIRGLVSYVASRGEPRVAVSADARSAETIAILPRVVEDERASGTDVRLVFLDASDASLVRRFSETRRPHPLAGEGRTLEEAIARERTLLAPIAELGHRVDTSTLTPVQLRAWIRDLLVTDPSRLLLCVESFGFKGGVPLDSDFVFDARFLPNPFYDPQLRPLTGKDAAVAAFLERETEAVVFLEDIQRFIERWLPKFALDRRAALTVAIGCTGGRHRSVYLVEGLAARLRAHHPLIVRHRDLNRD